MKKWIDTMFGFLNKKKKAKVNFDKFEIEPEMINSDVFRVDMKSLRNSAVVKRQVRAAQESFEREKATA